MVNDWQRMKLGQVCQKIGSGATPRGGKDAYRGGDTALIRSQNIYNNRFARGGLVYINDSQAQYLRNVVVEKGDVLLNITGDSVARCCQVDPGILPARVNQHVLIIRTKPDILDSRFLRYVLVSPSMQDRLLALASAGATRNALTKAMIESLCIQAPLVEEQRAIAHILGTLDDKIELNRKQNETLEAMARTMFRAWFVDFEPVRAKMEGRWKRGQSLPGMPAHLYDLFPSRLIETELGEIPHGWRYVASGDVYDVGIGKTPPRKESQWFSDGHGDVPWVSIRDMGDCGVFICETSESITSEAIEKFNIRRIPAEAVLLSFKLTIGRVAISECEMTSNEAIAHFKSKDGFRSCRFFYCYLSNYDYSSLGSTSSIATATNSKTIRNMPILAPSVEVVSAFERCVEPIFENIKNNSRQCRVLVRVRDIALPKLISGGVRIQNVERVLENMRRL